MVLLVCSAMAQEKRCWTITDDKGKGIPEAEVKDKAWRTITKTDGKGTFCLSVGTHRVVSVYKEGYAVQSFKLINSSKTLKLALIGKDLDPFTLTEELDRSWSVGHMDPVEGVHIYAGKKTEVVKPDLQLGNKATNSARQAYAKVTGLNVWENDGSGLQLNIGGRGLSPSRTSNFNTRQNGYDISADALGYPESYYTPPLPAIDRIEVVRGAASLQYGTQFGGLLNFRLHKGPLNKKVEVTLRNSVGSFGLLSSFSSLGGQLGKHNYYAYFQHRQGNGWRDYSDFSQRHAHVGWSVEPKEGLLIGAELTHMYYLAQQPGGLTDQQFEDDPAHINRRRNWFSVDWNIASVYMDYKISTKDRVNIRAFGLLARRDALGFLGQISEVDPYEISAASELDKERELLRGEFKNMGVEARWLHRYKLKGDLPSVFLLGCRLYNGDTRMRQGPADSDTTANFSFIDTTERNYSDFKFPSMNVAVFAENIFNLSERFSVTPGFRFESISTGAQGSQQQVLRLLNQQVFFDTVYITDKTKDRIFAIAGLGLNYKLNDAVTTYANFSQNYRAINFNDIGFSNPNYRVDPNLEDERGYNADLGARFIKPGKYRFEVTGFYLSYANKIGLVQEVDTSTFAVYRLRTNVSQSRTIGVETFGELSVLGCLGVDSTDWRVNIFGNVSVLNGVYLNSQEAAFEGKQVELVPPVIARAGLEVGWKNIRVGYQFSYTHQHYSDATNAELTANAVSGLVPSYWVSDVSAAYAYKWLTVEAGVNNLLDHRYFTRRASGYPGPGILPADARSFYVTLQAKF